MTQHAQPIRVCSFESRRAEEMRSLIERHGGVATLAPSMREIPLEENTQVFTFADALFAGRIDVVIFLTGVGARTLLTAVESRFAREQVVSALNRCQIIVRGPKPTVVLRKWKVRIDLHAPEPNTWREVLSTIDKELDVAGKTVAVQEYGESNEEFYRELQQRGAEVVPVSIYRWALPDDVGPMQAAIRSTLAGEFDILMFTTAQQVRHVLQVAERENCRQAWLTSAQSCLIASIGPTCSAALEAAGLPVNLEASPPKMGHLVRQALKGKG